MKDVDLALSEISNIRAQLVGSTTFVGISPGFNAVLAFFTCAVMLFQGFQQREASEFAYVATWGMWLLTSTLIVTVDAYSRAQRLHGRMAQMLFRTILNKLAPFMAAGIIITWVFCSFASEALRLLPGLWLMLLGLMGFALLSNVPKALIWVAGWYFAWGVLVLVVAGSGVALAPWMLGVPIAISHLAVAYTFNRAMGGANVCKQI